MDSEILSEVDRQQHDYRGLVNDRADADLLNELLRGKAVKPEDARPSYD